MKDLLRVQRRVFLLNLFDAGSKIFNFLGFGVDVGFNLIQTVAALDLKFKIKIKLIQQNMIFKKKCLTGSSIDSLASLISSISIFNLEWWRVFSKRAASVVDKRSCKKVDRDFLILDSSCWFFKTSSSWFNSVWASFDLSASVLSASSAYILIKK